METMMMMMMSEFARAASPRLLAAESVPSRIGKRLMRWYVAYMDWRLQNLAIDRLRHMSDRELKDIGLLRSQIEFEVRGGAGRHPALLWPLF
jgi:uncharacterized protein YjiS (DUF1127 family)